MVTKWLKLPLVAKKLQESEYFSWRLKKKTKKLSDENRGIYYTLRNVFLTSKTSLPLLTSHCSASEKSKCVDLPECHHIRLRNVSIEVLSWKLPPWALGVPEEKSLQRT